MLDSRARKLCRKMPPDTALNNDDDYVVSLLLKDAEANRKRYLQNGLGPLLSKRPKGNAPKPNTRFLENIVREADSHNASLKAKEEEEAKARLSELRGAKRRREDEDAEGSSKRKRGDDKPGRWANALGGLGRSSGRSEGRQIEDRRRRDGEESRQYRPKRREQASINKDVEASRRDRRSGRDRSRSRSRSPRHRRGQDQRRSSRSAFRSRNPNDSPKRNGAAARYEDRAETQDSDSDPLEDLVGPKPPPKVHPRGRGVHKSTADSINIRFSPSYNPKTDVDLSPDKGDRDDWDMALEALRDRAKWRSKGAERLRAAGFTEDEVEKWEAGGSGLAGSGSGDDGEKDVGDVRWRKKGEGREWDRGKVLDSKGGVSVKPRMGTFERNLILAMRAPLEVVLQTNVNVRYHV